MARTAQPCIPTFTDRPQLYTLLAEMKILWEFFQPDDVEGLARPCDAISATVPDFSVAGPAIFDHCHGAEMLVTFVLGCKRS